MHRLAAVRGRRAAGRTRRPGVVAVGPQGVVDPLCRDGVARPQGDLECRHRLRRGVPLDGRCGHPGPSLLLRRRQRRQVELGHLHLAHVRHPVGQVVELVEHDHLPFAQLVDRLQPLAVQLDHLQPAVQVVLDGEPVADRAAGPVDLQVGEQPRPSPGTGRRPAPPSRIRGRVLPGSARGWRGWTKLIGSAAAADLAASSPTGPANRPRSAAGTDVGGGGPGERVEGVHRQVQRGPDPAGPPAARLVRLGEVDRLDRGGRVLAGVDRQVPLQLGDERRLAGQGVRRDGPAERQLAVADDGELAAAVAEGDDRDRTGRVVRGRAAPVAKAWRAAATAANGRGVTAASLSPAASHNCRAVWITSLRTNTARACRSAQSARRRGCSPSPRRRGSRSGRDSAWKRTTAGSSAGGVGGWRTTLRMTRSRPTHSEHRRRPDPGLAEGVLEPGAEGGGVGRGQRGGLVGDGQRLLDRDAAPALEGGGRDEQPVGVGVDGQEAGQEATPGQADGGRSAGRL